ncbi:zinc finger CCHC domain-containing protein 12-like [Denticeps clupeoides]|uniref:zinc finger CCHC domain-containing protein 12-like n=1 Tax=Denticeps clupeoides TaxID=299321 RepID=UPI0010A2E7AE|nr:zinc finger CCHC domain-containing protein 12-like [Denticeps clupeoides]
MDSVHTYGVNLKNAIYVEGITSFDTDEQITKFCSSYGAVNKLLRIRQTGQENGVKALVEFESEESVKNLVANVPLYLPSANDPDVMWRVDRAYRGTSSLKTSTPSARPDLSNSTDSSTSANETDSDDDRTPLIYKRCDKSHLAQRPSRRSANQTPLQLMSNPAGVSQPSSDILNPPDVQKIIVEHVIRNDNTNASNQASKRLRPFSGKFPKPPGEADFQTWSLHVELMVQDKTPVDMQRRKILESLLPPASDLIRQLGPDAAPCDYVKLLESAYGLVEDGEEIFAKFLSTHQNTGERASEYLQRLQVLISTAIRRGGIAKADANRQLMRQFQRGCWDQSLILTLQLGCKPEAPDFSDFLLQLRTEEDRRATKQDRMQRHFSNIKIKSSMNMQLLNDPPSSHDANANVLQAYITETEALRKQVAELKVQLTNKREQRKQNYVKKHHTPAQETPSAKVAEVQVQQTAPKPMPKAWFCFKCGDNGHLARQCSNPPNKPLVDQKYKELKTKQDKWQSQYAHLNWVGLQ